jgi:hypothetical protein
MTIELAHLNGHKHEICFGQISCFRLVPTADWFRIHHSLELQLSGKASLSGAVMAEDSLAISANCAKKTSQLQLLTIAFGKRNDTSIPSSLIS